MTRPSSALRAPSPRARGEGEQVPHLLSVTPRPAERGEGDTKRSGVRVRGVSLAASSTNRAVPSLGMTGARWRVVMRSMSRLRFSPQHGDLLGAHISTKGGLHTVFERAS